MTTIAYCSRTKTLASDTQVTCGAMKRRASKVRRLKNGDLIAGSGDFVTLLKVFSWAETNFTQKTKPALAANEEQAMTFECLLVKKDGTMWIIDDDLVIMEHKGDTIGLGSGGGMALAAMACGKTPKEAVIVASQFDPFTSEPVDVWTLTPKRTRSCQKKPSKSSPIS